MAHIVSNLPATTDLVEDVQSGAGHPGPERGRGPSKAGAWYLMRILPYRTLDNVIEGAVITFVEITEAALAREFAAESQRSGPFGRGSARRERCHYHAGHGRPHPGLEPAAEKIYGWSETEALSMTGSNGSRGVASGSFGQGSSVEQG